MRCLGESVSRVWIWALRASKSPLAAKNLIRLKMADIGFQDHFYLRSTPDGVYTIEHTAIFFERCYSLIVDLGELEPDHKIRSANMKRHEEEGGG